MPYFDADLVPLADWDPVAVARAARNGRDGIVAVRDRMTGTIRAEAARAAVAPEDYFNSGLFVVWNDDAARAWLAAAARMVPYFRDGGPFDQTALNAARAAVGQPR